MIIVRLWGGLGNQLFQYAFGYALSQRKNEQLKLDCRFYRDNYQEENKRFTKREALIMNLPIKVKNIDICNDYDSIIKKFQEKNINRLIRIPKHSFYKTKAGFTYVKESRPQYDSFFSELKEDNLYFDGYWQSEKYFKEYRDDIVRQFTPVCNTSKYTYILDKINNENSVSIHVRRGDYLSKRMLLSNLYLLPMEYYQNSIKDAYERLKNPKFFLFTNDVDWLKGYFGEREDFTYISGTPGIDTIDEFYLMSKCKNQIIGNSTFSWWPAWLNQNLEKKVWAPERWFGNKDIIPDEWIKISF